MKQPYGHAFAFARSYFPITLVFLLATTALAACGGSPNQNSTNQASDIHKIRHLVVIMQENRSFDSYFGTFPGAAGIPTNACVPDPQHAGGCVRPYVDHADVNGGGPHSQINATADTNGGKMNGLVAQAEQGLSLIQLR